MALIVPGSTSSALALTAPQLLTGAAKLDPRFAAILAQNDVPVAQRDLLGDAGVFTTSVFGHIARTEEKLEKFLKRVLNLDSDVTAMDAIPIAKLVIVWETCRKRSEVEVEAAAHRVVNHMPPQLAVDDHCSAREGLEKLLGRKVPDHKIPSESYFEKKVGEIESGFKAEKLTMVTNLCQEERQRTPNAVANSALHFDNLGHPTLKTQKKDFYVQLPTDEPSLRIRFDVMSAALNMLKMRFISNPVLASVTPDLMRDYCDFLCGERVWGFVVRGEAGNPVSCPSLRHVLGYDQAIRDLQVRLIRQGFSFKPALESAMADTDTRTLFFTTGFGMDAHTPQCKALSAPGLREIYPSLPAPQGQKRGLDDMSGAAPSQQLSLTDRQAKNKASREKKKANKAAGAKPATPAPVPVPKAIEDRRTPKGKGKGKGGKGLPEGANSRTPEGKNLCFAWSKNEKCVQEPCIFEHACWFCFKAHRGCDCRANN